MVDKPEIKNTGLRGLKVADSSICKVDGQSGNLYYQGISIFDLAQHSTYEETAFLLIFGQLPTISQLNEFSSLLSSNRHLPQEVLNVIHKMPKTTSSMAILQAILSMLSGFDSEINNVSIESIRKQAIRIIAILPTIVAAWERIRKNQTIITPSQNLSHSANFLYMLYGNNPSPEIAKFFDTALILHAEHTFNNSTFTARVIASTQASIYASISGAIGALSGVLHGGANAAVMRNIQEIGEPENAETWVKKQFDSGNRIAGMGHAVYKTLDPRAKILKDIGGKLSQQSNKFGSKLILITDNMVKATQKEFQKRKNKEIYPNVDCYTAAVYTAMNIPVEIFTPIFTLSRTAGWTAHVLEQLFPAISGIKPVLYRPSADFQGKVNRAYQPLEQRDRFSNNSFQSINNKSSSINNTQFMGKNLEDIVYNIISQVVQKINGNSGDIAINTFNTNNKNSSRVAHQNELITEFEIAQLNQNGITELYIDPSAIITPLARDKARDVGMELIYKEI